MLIWIDLWAAPDPLFFRPIERRLRLLGHETYVTAREFGETRAIAERCGFVFSTIGRYGGGNVGRKISAIVKGAYLRIAAGREMGIDLAVSFNSYSQALAATALGVRFVTCMDYEYQPANHLAFRLADRVIVPRGFDERALRLNGGLSARSCLSRKAGGSWHWTG
jgi:predicted glycosyltransferase